MQTETIIIWAVCFVLLVLVVGLAVIAVHRKQKRKAQAAVRANSAYYKEVEQLNQKYHFYWDICEDGDIYFYEEESSLAKFDRRELEDIVYEKIGERLPEIDQALEHVKQNRALYQKYADELSTLQSSASTAECKQLGIPYKRFLKSEQKMVNDISISPICKIQIECEKEYTSPAGRNEYFEGDVFSEEEIRNMVETIKQENIMRSSEEYRRKMERRRVTDKLRYQILRRDGFRCQLCGASQADGVRLHVDHIIPVSKGGTSDVENLRTLCDRCNLGKGDQMEDEG